jgi:hypothetical protein
MCGPWRLHQGDTLVRQRLHTTQTA